jgi:uncharacterized protein (AIM24 family)
VDRVECAWCHAHNELTGSGPAQDRCVACGAPLEQGLAVTASGWSEAPRLGSQASLRFSQSRCQIEGHIVPVAELDLADGDAVFFEHQVLLWRDPGLAMSAMAVGGGAKRMLGGMPHQLNVARGPGRVALSRDASGEVVVLPVDRDTEIDVVAHAFLAGTHSLEYSYVRIKGLASVLHGGDGMFLDRFVSSSEPGLLLLHGNGNVFQRVLGAGETILLEPGALLYKDASVALDTVEQRFKVGLLGQGMHLARMTGPGRVGIQSLYVHHET